MCGCGCGCVGVWVCVRDAQHSHSTAWHHCIATDPGLLSHHLLPVNDLAVPPATQHCDTALSLRNLFQTPFNKRPVSKTLSPCASLSVQQVERSDGRQFVFTSFVFARRQAAFDTLVGQWRGSK